VPPVALNFWRWAPGAVILLPLAWPRLRRLWPIIRANFWTLLAMAATGVAFYQCLIYVGLRYTEAVNGAVFIGSAPVFGILCAWLLAG
jgi:drug/metabolite transporter (DMT)-like permease